MRGGFAPFIAAYVVESFRPWPCIHRSVRGRPIRWDAESAVFSVICVESPKFWIFRSGVSIDRMYSWPADARARHWFLPTVSATSWHPFQSRPRCRTVWCSRRASFLPARTAYPTKQWRNESEPRQTVGKRRRRFIEQGTEGLHDDIRSGRPRIYDERVAGLINRALQEKPRDANAWSVRRMAEAERVSKSTVHRLFTLHGIKQHRS